MGVKNCTAKCCGIFLVGMVSRIFKNGLREQSCKCLGRGATTIKDGDVL